jgi:hypothetical protein
MLMMPTDCEICQEPLAEIAFIEGQFVCRHHGRSYDIFFTPEEYLCMHTLATCEVHSQLIPLKIPQTLKEKITKIFSHFIT